MKKLFLAIAICLSSQTALAGEVTVAIAGLVAANNYFAFTDAETGNPIFVQQFASNCDAALLHAHAERKDHCNNSIKVRVVGTTTWTNYGLAFSSPTCYMHEDSYENKCEVAATKSTLEEIIAQEEVISDESSETPKATYQTIESGMDEDPEEATPVVAEESDSTSEVALKTLELDVPENEEAVYPSFRIEKDDTTHSTNRVFSSQIIRRK